MKKSLIPCIFLVLAGSSHGAEPTVVGCAPDNPNYRAYLGMTQEMFVPRNAEVADKYYAEEFYSHNQDAGGGGRNRVTLPMLKRIYEQSYKTFGERHFENELIVCQGDYVISRSILVSKMTGPWGGQAATGRTARISGIDIYKFKDGKVVERWGDADNVSMLWQLGLKLPPPPPSVKLQ